MIDEATIASLYAPRTGKKAQTLGKVFKRSEGSLANFEGIERMGDHDFGSYEGKVGSMRRSRRGVSRRLPNGRRYHVHGWWNEDRVLAYKLKAR